LLRNAVPKGERPPNSALTSVSMLQPSSLENYIDVIIYEILKFSVGSLKRRACRMCGTVFREEVLPPQAGMDAKIRMNKAHRQSNCLGIPAPL